MQPPLRTTRGPHYAAISVNTCGHVDTRVTGAWWSPVIMDVSALGRRRRVQRAAWGHDGWLVLHKAGCRGLHGHTDDYLLATHGPYCCNLSQPPRRSSAFKTLCEQMASAMGAAAGVQSLRKAGGSTYVTNPGDARQTLSTGCRCGTGQRGRYYRICCCAAYGAPPISNDDPVFRSAVSARWAELRQSGPLADAEIRMELNRTISSISPAALRNYRCATSNEVLPPLLWFSVS
eukprot:366462-Chlamydomonas_euryale.AAC.29